MEAVGGGADTWYDDQSDRDLESCALANGPAGVQPARNRTRGTDEGECQTMLGSPWGSKPQRMGTGRFAGLDHRAVEPARPAVTHRVLPPASTVHVEGIRIQVGGA